MELSIKDFDELHPYKLKGRKKPYAIMFKASYCGHCKKIYPLWVECRNRILFISFYTFTIDESPEKTAYFEKINNSLKQGMIEGFPTFLFYGKDIKKLEGSSITFDQVLEMSKKL